jgi:hypothetical protein
VERQRGVEQVEADVVGAVARIGEQYDSEP